MRSSTSPTSSPRSRSGGRSSAPTRCRTGRGPPSGCCTWRWPPARSRSSASRCPRARARGMRTMRARPTRSPTSTPPAPSCGPAAGSCSPCSSWRAHGRRSSASTAAGWPTRRRRREARRAPGRCRRGARLLRARRLVGGRGRPAAAAPAWRVGRRGGPCRPRPRALRADLRDLPWPDPAGRAGPRPPAGRRGRRGGRLLPLDPAPADRRPDRRAPPRPPAGRPPRHRRAGRPPPPPPRPGPPPRPPRGRARRDTGAGVPYLASWGAPPIPRADPAAGDVARGKEAFTQDCAGCHQVMARGGIVTGGLIPRIAGVPPRQLAEAVRIGPYLMPKFSAADVPQDELDDIAAYVRFTADPVNRGGWAIGNIGPIPEGIVTWLLGGLVLLGVVRLLGEPAR